MPRVKPKPIEANSSASVTLEGRRRRRGGEGRARRRSSTSSATRALRVARRARPEGHPAVRAARHRQDAARQGGRERVGGELLLAERLGLRRDVRRASAPPASASSSTRRARTRRRSSSSTSSTPSAPPARGHGFNREQDQTLNQLLVELDGFGDRDQVVVMGASNRLQDLDPALLRPGRFDRQVHVVAARRRRPRGDPARAHARQAAGRRTSTSQSVARQTAGLTGADLANITNEAAIFAGRREATWIGQAETSTAPSSASSPGCSSAASSARRRSGSSPTTRRGTRSCRT